MRQDQSQPVSGGNGRLDGMRILRELHAGPELSEDGEDPGDPHGPTVKDDANEAGNGSGTITGTTT